MVIMVIHKHPSVFGLNILYSNKLPNVIKTFLSIFKWLFNTGFTVAYIFLSLVCLI